MTAGGGRPAAGPSREGRDLGRNPGARARRGRDHEGPLSSAKFLVNGPLILALLLVINAMTSPGVWWVKWPALGIGIAWVVSLLRVLRAALVVGGLAAAWAWYRVAPRPGARPPQAATVGLGL